MHIKSLKIYCDVVDRRSFSRAADDNGISQSSASQAVQQLEERLGVKLLDRSRRPFVLTREGKHYYDGCRQLVRGYFQLEKEIRSIHDETSRRLLVASIYSVGLAHMSEIMQRFAAAFPKSQVRLEYLHPDRVYEVVEDGDVDFGVVSYPEDSQTLATIAWRSEPMVLVGHPNHRLTRPEASLSSARRLPSVSLAELSGERFVAFESGLRIRSEIDQALSDAGAEVDVVLEFDNIETMKRAIEINEGVSILPEPTVDREIAMGTLAKISLSGNPIERPLGIVHRRDRQLSGIALSFIKQLLTEASFENPPSEVLPLGEASGLSGAFSTTHPE